MAFFLDKEQMQISIIIVNWNAGSQLADAVSSIVKYHYGLVASVVIIDNASTDDSIEQVDKLQNLPFQIQIIHQSENSGFGTACNLGVLNCKTEYLLFLNPDAALYADTLPKALTYMQLPVNAKTGICGVQLFDEIGQLTRSCSRFPSVMTFVAQVVGLDRLLPRLGHFISDWDHTQTREVDHVIGAFFLIRRNLFELLGGFDERFFVYFEDIDFSYRAVQAGWRSVYLADTKAYHAGGGTSKQVKARRLFYSLRSRVLYAFKHFALIEAVVALLAMLLVEPLSRLVLALSKRSWLSISETWSAYALLWRWLPKWVFNGLTR